jgi:hypothetical protein
VPTGDLLRPCEIGHRLFNHQVDPLGAATEVIVGVGCGVEGGEPVI